MVKKILYTLIFVFGILNSSSGQIFKKNNTYSHSCGFIGQQPEKSKKMQRYILNKNISEINKWLFSFKRANLAYGAEAIIKLENNGYKIKKWQYHRVNRIKKMSLKVKTCRGCIGGRAKLKEALKWHEFTK